MASKTFTYVDLFAGCGGLSLGLERAGGELQFAVERSSMAAETFYHNIISALSTSADWQEFLALAPETQVEKGLLVSEVGTVLESSMLRAKLKEFKTDLVVGGPPCQGFSLAGLRRREDERNALPRQFLEVVALANPKMVVMENVVGMRHKFADAEDDVYSQLAVALSQTGAEGYEVQKVEVNAVHYGAPQHRPRLMLIALRRDIANSKGISATEGIWKSTFRDKVVGEVPVLAPVPTINENQAVSVGQALADLLPISQGFVSPNAYTREMSNSDWPITSKASAGLQNNVKRKHNEKTVFRFALYQALRAAGIKSNVFKVGHLLTTDPAVRASVQAELAQVDFPILVGQESIPDMDSLLRTIESLASRKHSQRILELDQPARTVVTIGDDYIHPVEPRTFSVRELARFQGFPNSFEFRSKETTGGRNRRNEVPQYSQVGNAVSPFMSWAVGKLVRGLIGGN
jgi:DNA (cytosine-5)-methyltransferase 1